MLTDAEEKKIHAAIGSRIKQALKSLGMTQADLASKVLPLKGSGKPQQDTISKWVNGTRSPTTIEWCMIAHVLNVSLDWLLLGKEGSTIQDIALSLSKLAAITDMHIEKCTQDGPEIKEEERNYNGIQITLFPRRENFYADDSLSSAISIRHAAIKNHSDKDSLIPMDRVLTIEDNRGDFLLCFLRRFTRDLEEYENNIYSRIDYDINSRIDLLISSLPPLSIAPISDNLNENELYQYPFTSAESKKIPWFIVENNVI